MEKGGSERRKEGWGNAESETGAREWLRRRRGIWALSWAVLKTHCWKPSVNSWLLFLDPLCLPVWPYNIIHLFYRFLGAFSLRDPSSPPGLKFEWSCNIKAPQVWAEGETQRARNGDGWLGCIWNMKRDVHKIILHSFHFTLLLSLTRWDIVHDCSKKQYTISVYFSSKTFILTLNLKE